MRVTKIVPVMIMLLSSSIPLFAKLKPDVFIISKITNHVYIAHPGLVKRINSTSTIILSKHYLTVIEAQTDVFMAKTLIREIRRKISKLPIKYLIFSHFHTDHILGAAAFLEENPALIIIAHQKTADHISQYGAYEQKSWSETIKHKSMEARQFAVSAKSELKKKYFLKAAKDLDDYSRDINNSKIILPNLIFHDSLTLYDGDFQLQLLFFGAGHTTGDIVAFLPEDKVLVTGDLVHDFEPLFWDADPDSWIEALEKIKQMPFEYFIGGHGDADSGKEIVYEWQDYIKELKAKARQAIQQGLTLKEFQDQISDSTFTSLQNGFGKRIQKFRTSYMEYLTGPLPDAVKDEIAFVWKFYYKSNTAVR